MDLGNESKITESDLLSEVCVHNIQEGMVPLASIRAAAGIWGVHPPPISALIEHRSSFFRKDSSEIEDRHTAVYPCAINWTHGGNKVAVTGDFTNWSFDNAIELIRNTGRQFTAIINLPIGIHRYKFIVDGTTWHYCPEQPQEVDSRGNVNNVLNMTEFDPNSLIKLSENHKYYRAIPKYLSEWGQRVPDMDELTLDCPQAPPQLQGNMKLDQEANGDSTVVNRIIYQYSKLLDRRPSRYKYISKDLVITSTNIPNVLLDTRIPDERRATIVFCSRPSVTDCHDPVLPLLKEH